MIYPLVHGDCALIVDAFFQMCHYSTRGHQLNLMKQYSRVNCRAYCFVNRCINTWNGSSCCRRMRRTRRYVFSHWNAVSSAEWRRRMLPSSLFMGQGSTMNQFKVHHCARGRLKPETQTVGSWPDHGWQLMLCSSLGTSSGWCRLVACRTTVVFVTSASSVWGGRCHPGVDTGQWWYRVTFAMCLSAAALHLSAGGSMLHRTGSHESGKVDWTCCMCIISVCS